MSELLNDGKALIAAFEAKDWGEVLRLAAKIMSEAAAILDMFKGLTHEEITTKVTAMHEASPIKVTATAPAFAISDIVTIISAIMAIFNFFKNRNVAPAPTTA